MTPAPQKPERVRNIVWLQPRDMHISPLYYWGAGPHALYEHIEVDGLPWRAALLAGLIAETMAGD